MLDKRPKDLSLDTPEQNADNQDDMTEGSLKQTSPAFNNWLK